MAKPSANNIDHQIGLRLKKLRQQAGLSAAALAEAIDSTQQQISRYENGQNKISATQLYQLSCHLRVPLTLFFLDIEPQKADETMVSEKLPPSYLPNSTVDETATLQAMWPRLSATQRRATLKLLDSFLE